MSDPTRGLPAAGVPLQALIERLIKDRVRASSFSSVTSIVCEMRDGTEWRTFDMVLDEIHDAQGLVAHAAHDQDRCPDAADAFDRLASALHLELSHLSEIAALELGQLQDYPYWGPVELCFLGAGLEYRLSEWDGPPRVGGDGEGMDGSGTTSPLPTLEEVAELEARLVELLRAAEADAGEEQRRLTDQIIVSLRSTEPQGIARVEVWVEVLEWGWPRPSIAGCFDVDGNQLEIDLDADEIDGLAEYVGLTKTIGSLTIDVSKGAID